MQHQLGPILATFGQLIPKYYVAPFFSLSADRQNCAQFPSLKCAHISLLTFQIPEHLNTLCLLPNPVGLMVLPCSCQCRRSPLIPSPLFFLFRTEEPAKADTCARHRRALQQIALNVHVKLSDLQTYRGNNLWILWLCLQQGGSGINVYQWLGILTMND